MHVIFSDVDALKMILLKTNLDVKLESLFFIGSRNIPECKENVDEITRNLMKRIYEH